MGQVSRYNQEQQKTQELEGEIRALRRQLGEKDKVIEILKNPPASCPNHREKYRCARELSRQGASVKQVCRELGISLGGYYGWLRHKPSRREQESQALKRRLLELHQKYPAMGLDSLPCMLKPEYGCSRKRVHRRMRMLGIYSARHQAYKATTNSWDSQPIAPNPLMRNFSFHRPDQAGVGDIT